jgi:hypothetical protein
MRQPSLISLRAAALAGSLLLSCAGAQAAVSVAVGEPGFYGRIDIGNFPQPVLVNPQPVIITPPPRPLPAPPPPLYLRVPPGHAKHWTKHCARYNACGQPVYFVQDRWYNDVYAPRYREMHGHGHGDDRGRGPRDNPGKGHGRGHDRD